MMLEKVKEIILKVAEKHGIEIDRIILFGSRARGDFREDSDWDILVVVREIDRKTKYRFISEVMDALLDENVEADIIVVSKEHYEKYKNIYGDISGIATIEGITLCKEEIKEKTRQWLNKGERDIGCKLFEGIYDYALFHSQQAIEKLLKAFLTFHNVPFGKTHNIKKLTRLCAKIDKDFTFVNEIGAGELYPKSIEIRYPTSYEPSKEEAREAIEIAEKVKDFVLKKLNL